MLTSGDGDSSDNNSNNNADSINDTDNGAHGDTPMAMMATIWIMLPCKSLEVVAHGC